MRFELTTSTLARLRSTPELRPRIFTGCHGEASEIIRIAPSFASLMFTLTKSGAGQQ